VGFLTGLFGGTETTIVTVLLGLAIVLVLIVLAVWLLKLMFNATGNVARGRNKRLSVIDMTPIDQKRQLVLVRRDGVEHLLMVGGAHELVIESGIPAENASAIQPRPARRPAQPVAAPASPSRDKSPSLAPAPALAPATPAASPLNVPQPRRPSAPPPRVESTQPRVESPQPRVESRQAPAPRPEPVTRAAPPPAPVVAPAAPDVAPAREASVGSVAGLGRPAADRRRPSLRHTGLLRPLSRNEPLIPNQSHKPDPERPDSGTKAPADVNGSAAQGDAHSSDVEVDEVEHDRNSQAGRIN